MRQLTTIIYGGAFNPPTVAHEAILKLCLDYLSGNGEVWVVPSGNRRDKIIPVERDIRLKYLDAMISDVTDNKSGTVKVITTEMDRQVFVETYDMAQFLLREYPDRHFIWAYGADSIETMLEWKNGQWLLDNLDMLVIKRRGSHIHPLAKNITALEINHCDDVSSTKLRQRIANNRSLDGLVGPRVKELLDNINKYNPKTK